MRHNNLFGCKSFWVQIREREHVSIAMLAKVTVQKFSCRGIECEDPLDNLLIAWDCMKAYYKANAILYRFRYMNKLTTFVRKKGFPKLRGTAAEIKMLRNSPVGHLGQFHEQQPSAA